MLRRSPGTRWISFCSSTALLLEVVEGLRLLDESSGRAAALTGASGSLNCSASPSLCQKPLSCDEEMPSAAEMAARIATPEGHSNLKSWCLHPEFDGSLVQECFVRRNLRRSAWRVFKKQRMEGNDLLDASYCFLEKHCNNSEVTVNTTVEEAELMCNRRFGDSWQGVGEGDEQLRLWFSTGEMHKRAGFQSRRLTQFYARMACAMGNYHCDVIYCKEVYCNSKSYSELFSHYLSELLLPGDPSGPVPEPTLF